jgi:hypothetical protein
LVPVPLGGLFVPLQTLDRGLTRSFRKSGGIVSNVESLVFPTRDVGGEFVGKIFVTGMLPKLNASAPYDRWIIGGGLRFHTEEIAEKILTGIDSKESFTKMNENSNVADRIRVEMLELKPVEIKKATEEGAGGEGQTPFSKMVE